MGKGDGKGSRERILRAAEETFSKKGFHLATVEEIAGLADVAKGTVFYNFGSKAALFEQVLTDGMAFVTGAIRKVVETDRPPAAQIAAIIELHVSTLFGNPGLIGIFSRELSNGLEEHVREAIRRTRDEYVAFVAGLLDEAKRHGIVKPLDSSMLASTLFDAALSACSYACHHPGTADAGGVAEFLKTLVLDGIGTG
jgi:AcrR family transcriptional regulator